MSSDVDEFDKSSIHRYAEVQGTASSAIVAGFRTKLKANHMITWQKKATNPM